MSWGCWLLVIPVAMLFVGIVWSRVDNITTRGAIGPLQMSLDPRRTATGVPEISDDSQTFTRVAMRANELAVALEQATRLGGPDLIGTYTEPAAASELYRGYLERRSELEEGARLKIKVTHVRAADEDFAEPVVTNILYLVSAGESGDVGRPLAREHWYWVPVRGRCEACGAPQVGSAEECAYCGAQVASPMRWVVRRIEELGGRLG